MDKLVINDRVFNVLTAVTPEDQEIGLMFKPWPPPVMIFPYKKATKRKFWMKNTISPLDIIFCHDQKVIGIFHGKPLSMVNVGPKEASDLVIEMPYGSFEKYNIKVGDSIYIKYSVQTLSKMFLQTLNDKD